MRILVAQMTRMGDMLQNSTLTRALRQRYPDAHITAMVRPLARAIAERNPDIDDIILYEEDAMFCDLRSRDSDRLLRAYRSAAALVDDLNARQFDIVYTSRGVLCWLRDLDAWARIVAFAHAHDQKLGRMANLLS